MNKNLWKLEEMPLFSGMASEEIPGMLDCLSAKLREYEKGEILFHVGDVAGEIGLILAGSIQIIKEDAFGNRSILGAFGRGELFGEAFSCARAERLPVTVIAVSDCNILLLNYKRVITTCTSDCAFHHRLVENMLAILAEKNIRMNQKIEYLSKRSIRDKLLSYLTDRADKTLAAGGVCRFAIPFTRQELADYLCVDRSAMSKELSKMKTEGLLDYDKNQFVLYL